MTVLFVAPLQAELDYFVLALSGAGFPAIPASIGRIPAQRVPSLDLLVARGGHGKTQFGVQTQHLLDHAPGVEAVICVGAAGALSGELAVGDVVIATETVEHDYMQRFSAHPLPRFAGDAGLLAALRGLVLHGLCFSLHFGIVASGDEDIIALERAAALRQATEACAVAWEGAGGARLPVQRNTVSGAARHHRHRRSHRAGRFLRQPARRDGERCRACRALAIAAQVCADRGWAAMISTTDELFAQWVEQARHDPDVVGLVLVSSRGKGMPTPFSDYDAYLIAANGARDRCLARYTRLFPKPDGIDMAFTDLDEFRDFAAWGGPLDWERYSFANATTLIDKTGTIALIVAEKGRIPPDKRDAYVRGALDAYINSVYRSAKCVRAGYTLGAHLEAAESIGHLLAVIFGLEGRHRPYAGYLERELHKYPLQQLSVSSEQLLAQIGHILATADLPTQQVLLATVASVARAAGMGDVIDGWGAQFPWMLSFQPGRDD